MQDESRKRAEQLRREKGVNLQIRVGINTGEVVLRSIKKDELHTDYVPVGQSTNLASRMESLATPGSIVVSEQTYKLTEGYFEFKSLELRATVSLARLWQQQGKREAHQMLLNIYSWFTEGFDTKDLQEAKTLLASLAEHHE